jgi:hypothetical protein
VGAMEAAPPRDDAGDVSTALGWTPSSRFGAAGDGEWSGITPSHADSIGPIAPRGVRVYSLSMRDAALDSVPTDASPVGSQSLPLSGLSRGQLEVLRRASPVIQFMELTGLATPGP